MLTLCGFAVSNYYNKVKMVLLEKGVPFSEELVAPRAKPADLYDCSPLGKVPYLKTPHGSLSESQVICEYLEAVYPEPPLLPADPFAAAKVRELCTFIDWHVEMAARDLYPQAFFGGSLSASNLERIKPNLEAKLKAFMKLARFAPYVAGSEFTLADCCAYVSLPLVGMATKIVYGSDMTAELGLDVRGYTKLVGQRPSAQRTSADRKAYQDAQAAAQQQQQQQQQ
jgi:glutathione S-transferase